MLRLSEILAWVGLGRYGLIPDDQSRSDLHKKTGPYSAVYNESRVKIRKPCFTSFCQSTSQKVKRKIKTFELSPEILTDLVENWLNNDMIGETGMVDKFDVSLSSSFIRKKSIFLMKLELSETSKLSTIPVSPIMSLKFFFSPDSIQHYFASCGYASSNNLCFSSRCLWKVQKNPVQTSAEKSDFLRADRGKVRAHSTTAALQIGRQLS